MGTTPATTEPEDRQAEHRQAEHREAQYRAGDACAAELLCDRHPADAIAFRVVEADLTTRDLTFGELTERSQRVAAMLADLGVGRGDAVGVLMSKSAELPAVLLGIWRLGAVHVPLFTAFAKPAIDMRLDGSGARVVVADADQAPKLAQEDPRLPAERRVVQVGGEPPAAPGWYRFEDLVATASPEPVEPVRVGGDGTLILLFTSGTTGTPKGVPVPVRALASMERYLLDALDVRPEDVFWNAADPGWAYGLYYAILGPLALGRSSILLHAGFSPALTWRVLDRFGSRTSPRRRRSTARCGANRRSRPPRCGFAARRRRVNR